MHRWDRKIRGLLAGLHVRDSKWDGISRCEAGFWRAIWEGGLKNSNGNGEEMVVCVRALDLDGISNIYAALNSCFEMPFVRSSFLRQDEANTGVSSQGERSWKAL